jgi:hypothetical protein
MKKLTIIALALLGLGVVSCQKEDIRPNSANNVSVPVWEEDNNNARLGESNEGSTEDPGTPGEITDPEEEEDATINKKHKGKN